MKKFKNKDIVFIDTVGRSQNNTKLLNSINDFLEKVKVDETYLVLNSTSDYKVMMDVAKKFKVLNYDALVFSKLDEAISFGNILNLVNEIKIPIKYLTNGQVIPDDIIAADSEFIANMVYTGKIKLMLGQAKRLYELNSLLITKDESAEELQNYISITSGKGGTGKSFIASNLAY